MRAKTMEIATPTTHQGPNRPGMGEFARKLSTR